VIFYNIILNLTKLFEFVRLNCSKLCVIVVHGIEITKNKTFSLPISISALANARKCGLLIIKLSKVMCTVEQTINVQMGGRGMAPLFLCESGLLILHTGRFTPGSETRYPFYRRLGGPQGHSGRVRKISPPPGLDSWTVQPV
jgi:hypothetical protein